jgi:GNAT superfamily N-acetyltransferase
MQITIRNIVEEDIPQVVDIQVEGWRTAYKGIIDYAFLDSINKEELIEKREKDYQDGPFVVAIIEEKIVGFCRYYDNVLSADSEKYDCEIMALYVNPELKRNGIGKKLFEHAKNEFVNQGKTKMIIWCLKDNYPSRTFYEKMGGKLIGEHGIEIGGKLYQEVGFGYDIE